MISKSEEIVAVSDKSHGILRKDRNLDNLDYTSINTSIILENSK